MLGLGASAMAKGHQAHLKGTLDVRAHLSHEYIPNYASSQVYASIKIKAKKFVSEGRSPLNVAVVMDRSSSMAGEKMKQSKIAALKLVDMLQPGDRLALVSYSSDVTVDMKTVQMTKENKTKVKAIINAIQPGGWTNLSGGFQKGCQLVQGSLKKGSINRVLLMSDGQANKGITAIPALEKMASDCLKKGVSMTSVGLGLDYNEDLMTAMAKHGAGNYYFVEKEAQMAQAFTKEIHGLASAVARKARLTIQLAPGVEMLKLHGYTYRAKGNTITVPLASFYSKQQKDILMKLSVSAQKSGKRAILSTSIAYEDTLNAKRSKATAKLSAQVSPSSKTVAKHVDGNVFEHAQRIEVANTMSGAMAEYEKGNKKKAIRMIEKQRKTMSKNQKMYKFKNKSAYSRVDKELKDMKSTISANSSTSAPAKRMRKRSKKRAYDISNTFDAF